MTVPTVDHLADVAHPRGLLEDDVAAGQRQQGRYPRRAVVDVGDRFHVLDRRELVGQVVADGLDSPGAVDLEEEQILFLLARLLHAARQVRDHDRVERAFELDPGRGGSLAQGWVFDGRLAGRSGRCRGPRPGFRRSACRNPSSRARAAASTPRWPPSQAGSIVDDVMCSAESPSDCRPARSGRVLSAVRTSRRSASRSSIPSKRSGSRVFRMARNRTGSRKAASTSGLRG